jgi:hypothetical protein
VSRVSIDNSGGNLLHFAAKPLPVLVLSLVVLIHLQLTKNKYMKNIIVLLVVLCAGITATRAQPKAPKTYRNFPLIVTVQFHSLASPFKDLESSFSHIGIGLGTEVSLNGKHNWAQQFQVSWYGNRQAGNGVLLYTQTAFRPTIAAHIYTEVKAGVGYTYSFRPVGSYKMENGTWTSAGHAGKWLLTVPVGISLGYNNYSSHTYVSPFVSYQILATGFYNRSVPLITNTLIQTGARIHLAY